MKLPSAKVYIKSLDPYATAIYADANETFTYSPSFVPNYPTLTYDLQAFLISSYKLKTWFIHVLSATPVEPMIIQESVANTSTDYSHPQLKFHLVDSSLYGQCVWMESVLNTIDGETYKYRFNIIQAPHELVSPPDNVPIVTYKQPLYGGFNSAFIDPQTKDYVYLDRNVEGQDSTYQKLYLFLNTMQNSSVLKDYGFMDLSNRVITQQLLSQIKSNLISNFKKLDINYQTVDVQRAENNRIEFKVVYSTSSGEKKTFTGKIPVIR